MHCDTCNDLHVLILFIPLSLLRFTFLLWIANSQMLDLCHGLLVTSSLIVSPVSPSLVYPTAIMPLDLSTVFLSSQYAFFPFEPSFFSLLSFNIRYFVFCTLYITLQTESKPPYVYVQERMLSILLNPRERKATLSHGLANSLSSA